MSESPELINYQQLAGEVIDGRYELLECIGAGGQSVVYRTCLIPADDSNLAIKILDPFAPAASRKRFHHEYRTLYQLDHPNIIRPREYRAGERYTFYTMPLLRGPTLAAYVTKNGPLSVPEALSLGLQLCDAVQAIHARGALHRDLSPNNVFLEADGVRIIDLGLVKLMPRYYAKTGRHLTDPSLRLVTGEPVGTRPWTAPEVFRMESGPESDVWSICALLWYALSSRVPFASGRFSQPPAPLPESVPRELGFTLMTGLDEIAVERIALADLYDQLEWHLEEWTACQRSGAEEARSLGPGLSLPLPREGSCEESGDIQAGDATGASSAPVDVPNDVDRVATGAIPTPRPHAIEERGPQRHAAATVSRRVAFASVVGVGILASSATWALVGRPSPTPSAAMLSSAQSPDGCESATSIARAPSASVTPVGFQAVDTRIRDDVIETVDATAEASTFDAAVPPDDQRQRAAVQRRAIRRRLARAHDAITRCMAKELDPAKHGSVPVRVEFSAGSDVPRSIEIKVGGLGLGPTGCIERAISMQSYPVVARRLAVDFTYTISKEGA